MRTPRRCNHFDIDERLEFSPGEGDEATVEVTVRPTKTRYQVTGVYRGHSI